MMARLLHSIMLLSMLALTSVITHCRLLQLVLCGSEHGHATNCGEVKWLLCQRNPLGMLALAMRTKENGQVCSHQAVGGMLRIKSAIRHRKTLSVRGPLLLLRSYTNFSSCVQAVCSMAWWHQPSVHGSTLHSSSKRKQPGFTQPSSIGPRRLHWLLFTSGERPPCSRLSNTRRLLGSCR